MHYKYNQGGKNDAAHPALPKVNRTGVPDQFTYYLRLAIPLGQHVTRQGGQQRTEHWTVKQRLVGRGGGDGKHAMAR